MIHVYESGRPTEQNLIGVISDQDEAILYQLLDELILRWGIFLDSKNVHDYHIKAMLEIVEDNEELSIDCVNFLRSLLSISDSFSFVAD